VTISQEKSEAVNGRRGSIITNRKMTIGQRKIHIILRTKLKNFSFQIMIKCSNVPSNCNIFITISNYIRLRFEKQFYSEIYKVKNCLFNQYLNLYNQKNRKIWRRNITALNHNLKGKIKADETYI
jgi:hypothetical protein